MSTSKEDLHQNSKLKVDYGEQYSSQLYTGWKDNLSEDTLAWARGFKTFFMFNSAEHEILKAHDYINVKKFSIFRLRKV